MKTILLTTSALLIMATTNAQSLKTKEATAKLKGEQIPEYQKKFTELSPAFSKLVFNVDYASFGNKDEELSNVFNQFQQVYNKVEEMVTKNKVTKEEIEKRLKKISVKSVANESMRSIKFAAGDLMIACESFNGNYFYGEPVINALYTDDIKSKEAIVKNNEVIIPEYQAKFGEISPKLAKIAINIDTKSFGNYENELNNLNSQINHVVNATKSLADRSKSGMEAVESGLKKVTLIKVKTEKERSVSMKAGELIIKCESFYNNAYYGTALEEAIEKGL